MLDLSGLTRFVGRLAARGAALAYVVLVALVLFAILFAWRDVIFVGALYLLKTWINLAFLILTVVAFTAVIASVVRAVWKGMRRT